MKNFFDEACNVIFTCEGLQLLLRTLSTHSDEIIRQKELYERNIDEPEGTELGREILKTLRDCSSIDDDKQYKEMPNLIFALITEKHIKESLKDLRKLLIEKLKDGMEPLETTFHELASE